MPEGEFGQIPVQVFRADVVVSPRDRALQLAEEILSLVGAIRELRDVLANVVIHNMVSGLKWTPSLGQPEGPVKK